MFVFVLHSFLVILRVHVVILLLVVFYYVFDLLQIVHMRATLAKMDPPPTEIADIPEALRTTHRQFGGMSPDVWYQRACLALLSDPNWELLKEGYQNALDAAHASGKGAKVNRTFPWTVVTKACQQVVPLLGLELGGVWYVGEGFVCVLIWFGVGRDGLVGRGIKITCCVV